MLVILKIPVVYLCLVVWWAIRAEPEPLEGAPRLAPVPAGPACGWRHRRAQSLPRGPRPRPGAHSGRPRSAVRYARARLPR